ncbi:hypothetical protein SISSUDRAFT_1037877 [Sistotremastrum suecicum HHB10207 ss-3]|uniref:Uncharacterized protein n=1 Tax=Sistotremastrum suecicum HHB10207 ss-3 TaxID=1314776 RepID=A0A165XJ00_9AGAM|nr:hypothetical protein SISSUDRAFT_1037877 [Sistotremastrum suecicum HHB10207 ss-3]
MFLFNDQKEFCISIRSTDVSATERDRLVSAYVLVDESLAEEERSRKDDTRVFQKPACCTFSQIKNDVHQIGDEFFISDYLQHQSVLSRFEFGNIRVDDRQRSSWLGLRRKPWPTILVGMDIEWRSDPEEVHRLFQSQSSESGQRLGPVLLEEGERIALKSGATKYIECSLADKEQVKAVFREDTDEIFHLVNHKAWRLASKNGSWWNGLTL